MMTLPDFDAAWDHENAFYLTAEPVRLAKALSQHEIFKRTLDLPGHIADCGVFKGASFCRWAMFREMYGLAKSRKLIGFDIFGTFPETSFEADKAVREKFVASAGDTGISTDQLRDVLAHKGITQGIDLVAGDICETVPAYVAAHPELKLSIINLDTDIYEPAVAILEHLYPRLMPGGILIVDDYGVFPGETKAVDDYFSSQNITIQKLPFAMTPSFIVKPG